MTARSKPSVSRIEAIESEVRKIKTNIHTFESVLANKDHPILEPFINELNKKEINLNADLDDYLNKSEVELKVLLAERLLVRSLKAFDDMEMELPRMRQRLQAFQKELSRGKQEI